MTYNILTIFLDDGTALCQQMLESYSTSLAPGTLINRRKQAEEYVRFAVMYNFAPLAPSITNACMFAQHLALKHAAPGSLKNSISGARLWIQEHNGYLEAFNSIQLSRLVKSFVKKSTHVPRRAARLLPHHIKRLCSIADSSSSFPLAFKPAILIGYTCLLRGSNLLSPSTQEWAGPHTLLAKDITRSSEGLLVLIRSTKTRCDPRGQTFTIPLAQDPSFCPVLAWDHYKAFVNPAASGPAFIQLDRRPLTPTIMVKIMRAALMCEQDIIPTDISMHSLRRGATAAAVNQGLTLAEIKLRGTWKSDSGIRPYLAAR